MNILTKFKNFFNDYINWCEAEYSDGREKPENKVYHFIYRHWLWPLAQNDCVCCNTVRGMIYVCVIWVFDIVPRGVALAKKLWYVIGNFVETLLT